MSLGLAHLFRRLSSWFQHLAEALEAGVPVAVGVGSDTPATPHPVLMGPRMEHRLVAFDLSELELDEGRGKPVADPLGAAARVLNELDALGWKPAMVPPFAIGTVAVFTFWRPRNA